MSLCQRFLDIQMHLQRSDSRHQPKLGAVFNSEPAGPSNRMLPGGGASIFEVIPAATLSTVRECDKGALRCIAIPLRVQHFISSIRQSVFLDEAQIVYVKDNHGVNLFTRPRRSHRALSEA
jgi:hypothetical protein